jgi:hypothetical protein
VFVVAWVLQAALRVSFRRAREAGLDVTSWRRQGESREVCKIGQNAFFAVSSIWVAGNVFAEVLRVGEIYAG